MRMTRILTLLIGGLLVSCSDSGTSQPDAAVDLVSGADDGEASLDQSPTSRTIKGQISDPMVNKVVAISEKTGTETVGVVSNGAFVLSALKTDEHYLLDFRNGVTSQGWLLFGAGAVKGWVIPRGTQEIDLGKCVSDTHMSFTSANSPLDATDDDGDGIVDSKDGYLPTPATLPSAGSYKGLQKWNLLEYGIAFVPDSTDKSKWTVFLSQVTAPDCKMPQRGVMEQFGDGFIGLFREQYLIAVDCKVSDHLQLRMTKQKDGSYLGTYLHYLIGLDSTCVSTGCMGTPPHGGAYTLTRLGDTTCK